MAQWRGPGVILGWGLVLHLALWSGLFVSAITQQQGKKVYRVTVKEEMPYIFQTPGSSEGPNSFEGLLIDVLDRVSKILDVTFSLNHVGDGAFGERRDDGTWTGMIGELQRNESDIAAGPLTVTADRARIVDFSRSFSSTGLRILVKRPENTLTSTDHVDLFVQPFSVGVWVLVLATAAVLQILQSLNQRFNPKEKPLTNEKNYEYEYCPAIDEKRMHTSKAGWILSASSKVFVVSSVTFYTAQLTSILVHSVDGEKQYLPFVTFEGLLNHPDINYSCLDKSFACKYFETSVQSLEKSIEFHLKSGRNTRYNNIDTATRHLRRSTTKPQALIIESDFAYYVTSQEPCDLIVVGEELGDISHSFACRPGLNICHDLDVAILTLKSTGELGRLRNKWLSGPCGKYSEMTSPYAHANKYTTDRQFTKDSERTVKSFAIPLAVVYSGVVVGICMMLWEIYRPKSKTVKMFRIEYHDRSDGIEIESGSDVIK
ncbi:glutamate receptor 1-like [Mizuhopecten yessoensis]|uniref:Glutamate receptor 1 n=1 Tax=Mizuhopecten yessoensis TaxID=6573 RepID=A0A210Q6S4_MIZYE|nr:glutamate receptor 1-like [Mizuhopecten yessoensis]OWF44436.1 Glutamate receptor 1 [Mizuhopecten yessoensis]